MRFSKKKLNRLPKKIFGGLGTKFQTVADYHCSINKGAECVVLFYEHTVDCCKSAPSVAIQTLS